MSRAKFCEVLPVFVVFTATVMREYKCAVSLISDVCGGSVTSRDAFYGTYLISRHISSKNFNFFFPFVFVPTVTKIA